MSRARLLFGLTVFARRLTQSHAFLPSGSYHQIYAHVAPTVPVQVKVGGACTIETRRRSTFRVQSTEFGNEQTLNLVPLQEVTLKLHKILDNSEANQTLATEGYIIHKRSFGSSLAFIDLIHGNEEVGTPPLQALIKRQSYNHSKSNSVFASMLKSMLLGTKVYIEGVASSTQNPGEVVLLVTHLKFLKSSRNPEHVKGMLQRLNLYLDSNGDDSEETKGLALEEFDGVFGPAVDLGRLKEVLLGNMDAECLFDNGENSETKSDQSEGAKRKIAYAKLARLIVNHLPEDEDYPTTMLDSKGRDANKMGEGGSSQSQTEGAKRQYSALPMAPSNIKSVPTMVMDEMRSRVGNDDDSDSIETAFQSSILELLDDDRNNVANDKMEVTVSGWVQNRRRFQGDSHSIAVLELVDELALIDSISDKPNRLQCVLHPDCIKGADEEENIDILPSDAYGNLMSKGAQVLLQGYYSTSDGRPTLWVKKARLQRSTWRPAVIRYFLDLISGSDETARYSFDIEEVASALDMGHSEARDLVESCKTTGSTERQWRAAELSRTLQDSNSRAGHFTDEMKAVLEQNSLVRARYPLEHIDHEEASPPAVELDTMPMRRRQGSLRKSAEGSRWKGKKRPQLEWMVRQIKEVVESHPDFGSRPLNILDVGGGRGHLSNYLSSVLGDDVVTVHVIDIDSRTVKNGMMDAKRKGLNVRYGVGDASSGSNVAGLLRSEEGESNSNYDVIVALHACGALSDVALGHAVVNKAGFVITPCCFRSNPHLRVSLPASDDDGSDPVLVSVGRQKLVRPSEWLGMEEDSMVALTQAAEIQGDIDVSGEAIHTLCALRARAVENHAQGSTGSNAEYSINVGIKTFPLGFSTRNYCIVGKF